MTEKLIDNKEILIISPEPWGENYVSKHHYAIELSKRNRVYFLNPPSHAYGNKIISDTLIVVDYKPLFRGIRFLPFYLSGKLIQYELRKLEQFLDTSFEIIWNFDSSRFFNLYFLKGRLRIVQIVDYSQRFQLRTLVETSDIGFCTSGFILEEMQRFNPKIFNIGHGVTIYDAVSSSQKIFNFNKGFKFKAAYVGNLSIKYIDWEIINELVNENPLIAFYFIGPIGKSNLGEVSSEDPFFSDLRLLPNSIFTGPVESDRIIPLLKEMDILLLIYKSNQFMKQLANPHKVLEYLAAGKVVVSSWTDEYKDSESLMEMMKINSMLPEKFKEVIQNLEYYNSLEKQSKRMAFARANTYEKKIEQIEQLIQEHVQK